MRTGVTDHHLNESCSLLHVKSTTRATYSKQHTKCLINVKVTGWGTLTTEYTLYSSQHTAVTDYSYSTLPSCKKISTVSTEYKFGIN